MTVIAIVLPGAIPTAVIVFVTVTRMEKIVLVAAALAAIARKFVTPALLIMISLMVTIIIGVLNKI